MFRYLTGIENTLRAIDVTNEDSLATNVTEELIILKYELDYSIDQTSTLQSKYFYLQSFYSKYNFI